MSEPRFTPGPWQWWTSNSWRRLTAHNGPGGQYERDGDVLCPIVQHYDRHPDVIVDQADMDLIAAAPDLYEALTLILPLAKGYRPEGQTETAKTTCWKWIAAAEAALAKARGESS